MTSRREGTSPSSHEVLPEHIPFPIHIDMHLAQAMCREANEAYVFEGQQKPVCYYQELLAEKIDYRVYRYKDTWEFQLIDHRHKTAELVFHDNEHRLELTHRLVRPESKQRGVTGTVFLQKTEAYLRFLRERQLVDAEKPLGLNAGQKEVIEWAQKNGFRFERDEDQALFEQIVKNEAGEHVLDVVDAVPTDGFSRRGYMMTRERHDAWQSENERLKQENARRGPDEQLPLVSAARAAVRFQLVKDLPSAQPDRT